MVPLSKARHHRVDNRPALVFMTSGWSGPFTANYNQKLFLIPTSRCGKDCVQNVTCDSFFIAPFDRNIGQVGPGCLSRSGFERVISKSKLIKAHPLNKPNSFYIQVGKNSERFMDKVEPSRQILTENCLSSLPQDGERTADEMSVVTFFFTASFDQNIGRFGPARLSRSDF